jgi:hypothetical protein
VAIGCSVCGAARQTKPTANGLPRLPTRWHRLSDQIVCANCWSQKYMLRAVTFPVTGPVGRDWKDLRAALVSCWAHSTALANWCVTELAKADVVRMPNDGKTLPAMPRIYLYPEARRRFPDMSATALNAVLHTTERRYRKARLGVIWRCEANLPRYRYPAPYPVNNQGWKAYYGPDKAPLVDLPLAGERWTLRLDSWWNRKRQLLSFGKIVSGEAVKGELAIYRVRANPGDHRSGIKESSNGGGPAVHYRIMVKMSAWLPRKETGARQGLLTVQTGTDCLWMVDGEPWLYADNVRRWCENHSRFLKRVSSDNKYEKRWPKRARANLTAYRELRCQKFHNRIRSAVQEWTAMLVNYADRRGIAEIQYDDSEKSYLTSFPWYDMARLLQQKSDDRGIRMSLGNGQEAAENQELAHEG